MKIEKCEFYTSNKGRKLGPNNLKGTKLGSLSWESGPESGPHRELRVELSRCSRLLRAAQARNSLAQPQLRAAYSSLRLQSRVLRSQSGNGIWRGQVWCASIGALVPDMLSFKPPKSWKNPATHSTVTLQDPWYAIIGLLQDRIYHESVRFFSCTLGYRYALLPLTTDSISSPLGLGSDSMPVSISLFDRPTHLADSMQFSLEYMLRVIKGCPGFYYLSPSFRGEDPDATHLNQFYHIECEHRGTKDEGMKTLEQFVFAITTALWQEEQANITSIAKDTSHITKLIQISRISHASFPRITLDDAIDLLAGTEEAWAWAVPSQPSKGRKLTRRGELALIQHFAGPVWLTHLDHLSVPFYQAYADSAADADTFKSKAKCVDLLMGIGETAGLGERHSSPDTVRHALRHHHVPADTYQWYMDMRVEAPMQTVG
jgi:L-asparaginase / beta-aspartyl-peptidase